MEKDGAISVVTAISDYDKLNKEIERISNLYQNQIRLLDKEGNSYRKKTTLPVTIVVE